MSDEKLNQVLIESKQKQTTHFSTLSFPLHSTMHTLPKPFHHHHHHHHHTTTYSLILILTLTLSLQTTLSTTPPNDAVSLLKFKQRADTTNTLLYTLTEPLNHCQWQGVKCVQGRVVRLVLQSHGLTGIFADHTLSQLTNLRVLSLRNNSLTGSIPNLSPLINLKTLFLDHNTFSGSFPVSLTSLHRLQSLNLARNNLSGSIPLQVNYLDRLIILRLEWNRFTGSIPALNLTVLQAFNVSANNLTGPVPVTPALSRFDISSYLLNPSLCGKIVNKICASKSPFFNAASGGGSGGSGGTAPASVVQNGESEGLVVSPPATRRHKRVGIILGFIIAVLTVVAVVLLIFAILNQRSYRNRTKSVAFSSDAEDETGTGNRNGNGNGNGSGYGNAVVAISANNTVNTVRIVNKQVEIKDQKVQLPEHYRERSGDLIFCDGDTAVYGMEQLMSASAELLGRGTIGTTYKAVMDNQVTVTVKRLDAGKTAVTSGEGFEKHLEVVGRLRHPNLVPVRAYFQANQVRLVIYDYQANDSLFNLIHGSRSTRAKPLHWTSCLKIAEDIALGLAYIHQTSRLIHNNLKLSNVLLGPDFEACLTDYCLLVLADPACMDESIPTGYKAPELRKSYNRATAKSDVYAFGVLLLELLSGRPPSQHPHLVPEDMAEWVSAMRENDDMPHDNRLGMLVEVAAVCSMTSPEQRPVMTQVLKMLQEIKETACMTTDNDYMYNGYS